MISAQLKASCYPQGKAETIHKEGKGEDNHWGSLNFPCFTAAPLGREDVFPGKAETINTEWKGKDNPCESLKLHYFHWERQRLTIQKGRGREMLISGKLKVSRFPQGRQRLSTKRRRGREKIIRRSLKIPRFPLGKGNYFHREGRDYPHRQGRQRLSTQKGRGRQKMIFGQLKTSCFPYWQTEIIHKEGKGKGEFRPFMKIRTKIGALTKCKDIRKCRNLRINLGKRSP